MITVSIYCRHCSRRTTISLPTYHSLASSMCPGCGSPLSETTPESLAQEALVQSLNTQEEQYQPKITHKRDTKPQSSRGPGNEMLRRIAKK
jgi:hypothetical protein